MLLVVALHAALGYTRVEIPRLIWAIRDSQSHPFFDVFCWWSLGISSPFFLMSGFFAADLIATRGPGDFLKNRVKRIGIPFLAAGVLILPPVFVAWVCGWFLSDRCTVREVSRMKFHAPGLQENLYGPAHLWSLEYLVLMLAAIWAWSSIRGPRAPERTDTPTAPGRLECWMLSPWRPLLPALPTALILWAGHRSLGIDAIMDRQNSFVPEPFRLSYNAIFFAVGVGLHRLRRDHLRLAEYGPAFLALSVPAFAARASLVARDFAGRLDGPASVGLAISGALFAWLLTFGLLGTALRFSGRPRPVVRYLADSSYWIYLIHLPIVGLLQIDLASIPGPATPKFVVVLGGTLAIGLLSYHYGVRHTPVGARLHGPRARARPTTAATLVPTPHFGRSGGSSAPGTLAEERGSWTVRARS
jgi:peptidoglycan/LPS O-acetylase OafA/YrhL